MLKYKWRLAGHKLGEVETGSFSLIPDGVPPICLDIVAEEIGPTGRRRVSLWAYCRKGIRDLADSLGGDTARPRADRGFAPIGYGLPGAMGAKLAAPGRQVVGITGDGGFNMVIGELETAKRMRLGITVLIVNNAASGYVKALQHLMYGQGGYQSSDLVEMNYAVVATAMGCNGIRVDNLGRLAGAIESGLNTDHVPTIIDVVVTREPGQMLPGVDRRTVTVKEGDRVA